MKPRYLLDTSVFSQPLRRNPIVTALQRWADAGDAHCCVSAVVVAEVEYGLHYESSDLRWKKYRALIEERLQVVEMERDVWQFFSQAKARQRKAGAIVSDLDLMIAATAMVHDMTVATLNGADFSRVQGLRWEDWGE
jgi:tRNA(fMet)-specific endonuclease VapC